MQYMNKRDKESTYILLLLLATGGRGFIFRTRGNTRTAIFNGRDGNAECGGLAFLKLKVLGALS